MNAAPKLPLEAAMVDLQDLEKGESITMVSNGRELLVVPNEELRKIDAIAAADEDFDWARDDSVVLRHQPGVAIYHNMRGDLVIRQEGQFHPDEDVFVYVAPQNIAAFIDKLTDVCGIPSAGKRR